MVYNQLKHFQRCIKRVESRSQPVSSSHTHNLLSIVSNHLLFHISLRHSLRQSSSTYYLSEKHHPNTQNEVLHNHRFRRRSLRHCSRRTPPRSPPNPNHRPVLRHPSHLRRLRRQRQRSCPRQCSSGLYFRWSSRRHIFLQEQQRPYQGQLASCSHPGCWRQCGSVHVQQCAYPEFDGHVH